MAKNKSAKYFAAKQAEGPDRNSNRLKGSCGSEKIRKKIANAQRFLA
jgi:hypothetical protein